MVGILVSFYCMPSTQHRVHDQMNILKCKYKNEMDQTLAW